MLIRLLPTLLIWHLSIGMVFGAMDLTTTAEKSGWLKTGRYDEAIKLCRAFEKNYRGKVRCQKFGKTPENRPLLALVASQNGLLDAKANRSAGRPVVLFQGGIHAGEIDGKDAGFAFLRDLLEDKVLKGVLSRVTVVFVPVFNVDGHERFGKWNRPNQIGPEEMGWRTTAQNLNLNRDYLKADAPEMASMLQLLNEWDPILYMDLHVTDGAQFQHDVAVLVEPLQTGSLALRANGKNLSDTILEFVKAKGGKPLAFYPSFRVEDDPASGINYQPMPVRFSHGYWAARNRLGVLVETHSWKDYATRVKLTYEVLESAVGAASSLGKEWLSNAAKADSETSQLAGNTVPLTFRVTSKVQTIDFLGVRYTREKSPVSGAIATTYFPKEPQVWKMPLYSEIEPELSQKLPQEGYYIPPAIAEWMQKKLELHGIVFHRLSKPLTEAEVETFRATEATYSKSSFEGRTGISVKGSWLKEKHAFPAGTLFVPIAQPNAFLIAHLLEPLDGESLLAWGFFNNFFEQKEYMEPYVAEAVAKEMLKDEGVRRDFEKQLEDAAFAKSPERRLEFFYRRHASWDGQYQCYPIMRR